MKLGPLFSWIAVLYSIAIFAKVVSVRLRNEPYRFTGWDGGLMLKGTALGPKGTYVFGAFIVALGSVGIWLLNAWSKL